MARPELLAPAGGIAALHAAVARGADAVYLGLPAFSARRSAENFTIEALAEACRYAHARGVRVYVTMNTVVLPGGMPEALRLARDAQAAGADAFIVQDVGLAQALLQQVPGAQLHCSTQMNIHSAAGIRMASRLGASRVTLARELSLAEVEALAAEAAALGMQVETFVHGALCVCYSGQCLMSSMIGGRSANRGACAQACRLPYELLGEGEPLAAPGEHLLSPADLCAVDLLGRLVRAGVSSFKIEGRMKSPEYVGTVVRVYRQVLDEALAQGDAQATDEDRAALASVFSRGFTTAYLEGDRGNAMMSYQRPNNRGVFVGRVRELDGDVASVALEQPLEPGDLIEFWTRKGQARMEVTEPLLPGSGDAALVLDDAVRGVRSQDRIFKVRSASAAVKLEGHDPRIPVRGRVAMRLGQPLSVSFSVAPPDSLDGADAVARAISERLHAQHSMPLAASAEGDAVEAARTRAVSAEDVAEHVGRMGATDFQLVGLDIDLDEGVGIGFSALHHARSAALDRLMEAIQAPYADRTALRIKARNGNAGAPVACMRAARPLLAALATNPACARAAKRVGAEVVYVPASNYLRGQAQYAGVVRDEPEQAGYPKDCALVMPEVCHDPIGAAREALTPADAWEHVASHQPLMVEGLAGVEQARALGCAFEVGPHVPVANAEAASVAHGWGATRAWLTPELNMRQIEQLAAASPLPLGIAVAGRQMLMTMEHCALMSQGPCAQQCASCQRRSVPHALRDRKGFEFPVVTDAFGRSRIYNSVPLDTVHAIGELWEAGVSAFLVDATLMDVEQAAQAVGRTRQTIEAAITGQPMPPKRKDATSGHLFRGVS